MIDLSSMTQAEYDVYSALRGPDVPNGLLKCLTTGVIRYLACMSSGYGVIIASPTHAKTQWLSASAEERAEAKYLWKTLQHYRVHVERAFSCLEGRQAEYWDWLNIELNWTP